MLARETRTPGPRWPLLAALLVGGLAFAMDVRLGVYAANITDSSAYVAAGDLWRTGEIFRPVPMQLWGQWPGADQSLSSLGFRPALQRGAEIVEYPLGYPLLIAAATAIAGAYAAYLVSPVMHAVLVWGAFALTRRIGGDLAGLLTAVLVASNSVAVMHGIHSMSDVPAAACWVAAWAVALRPGAGAASASGLLASLAVMIRPNLAPLAAVLGLWWLWFGASPRQWRTWHVREAVAFGASAAIGPALVAWSQLVLYGGVLTPGYPGASAFFRVAYLVPNLTTYPDLFVQVHGWLPLLGLLLIPAAVFRVSAACPADARPLVYAGVALSAIDVAAYLFYLPYDTAFFLRFFLVAITVLIGFYAVLVSRVAYWMWQRPAIKWLAPLIVVAALWPAVRRPDITRFLLEERRAQARIQLMGYYLREVLDRDAVALAFFHTGAVTHYARRNVLRLDLVPADRLDAAVDALQRGGASPVFVIDELLEEPQFRERFKGTRYGALDWPPRAEFVSQARIRYWIAADRDRHLAGERWATDVLR